LRALFLVVSGLSGFFGVLTIAQRRVQRAGTVSSSIADVDPRAWLACVLEKLPDHPASRVDEFLPWNWKVSGRKRNPLPPSQLERVAANC
jgi:hypothetical protein